MTKEEIKETYSIRDILARYDLHPDRRGYIPCPFHAEKTSSLKVYDRDFCCFGECGANGDIFTFVPMMEDVSFKEAFQLLGGAYGEPTCSARLIVYKAQKRREMKRKEQRRLAERRRLNNMLISVYRAYMKRSEPFSDVWTDCYNRLQYQLYVHAEINGIEAR